jgi:putative ABC transport system substrate-binding protein
MKRGVRVLLAFTAFPLIAAFYTGAKAQTRILRVGVLNIDADNQVQGPFYRTLREHGWVEGKNVVFERRDAAGDSTRLAEPAAELVRLKVDVLFPVGPPSVRAALAATRDTPIVAHDLETDSVAAGRGNLTGVFLDAPELAGKWVELLKTIVPSLSRVIVLWDPTSGPTPLDAVRKAALVLGVELQVLEIHIPEDIDKAPSAFRGRPQAMIVLPSPMMWYQSARRSARDKIRPPAIMMFLPVHAGGYWSTLIWLPLEQCARLLAKVLGGAKPRDSPVERPSKFEFVLNLKTARDFQRSFGWPC